MWYWRRPAPALRPWELLRHAALGAAVALSALAIFALHAIVAQSAVLAVGEAALEPTRTPRPVILHGNPFVWPVDVVPAGVTRAAADAGPGSEHGPHGAVQVAGLVLIPGDEPEAFVPGRVAPLRIGSRYAGKTVVSITPFGVVLSDGRMITAPSGSSSYSTAGGPQIPPITAPPQTLPPTPQPQATATPQPTPTPRMLYGLPVPNATPVPAPYGTTSPAPQETP